MSAHVDECTVVEPLDLPICYGLSATLTGIMTVSRGSDADVSVSKLLERGEHWCGYVSEQRLALPLHPGLFTCYLGPGNDGMCGLSVLSTLLRLAATPPVRAEARISTQGRLDVLLNLRASERTGVDEESMLNSPVFAVLQLTCRLLLFRLAHCWVSRLSGIFLANLTQSSTKTNQN